MDVSTAEWLVSPDAAELLAAAQAEPDPSSLKAATRLRALCPPERAAAVLDQAALRRRARVKAGADADRLFWTSHGLEQATRPVVAARRAARFVALGATRVVDLGCGCGLDALAFVRARLDVTAVDADPVTAVLARANLRGASGGDANVLCGDAETLAPGLLAGGAAVFCDPSRRTAAGRTWRIEDFSPSWGFVTSLLDGGRLACAKLGPGLPHSLIPDAVETEWVSVGGDLVEAALWAGPGTTPGRRRAVVDDHELTRDAALAPPPVGRVGEYVYEPDAAVIRSGLVPAVAEAVGAWRLHDGVAYLTASGLVQTPFAEAFAVDEVLPYSEKGLRAWVRERGIGVLEIKKRGVDADPAALRRRLRPAGPNSATLILTPTASGAQALVARRLVAG